MKLHRPLHSGVWLVCLGLAVLLGRLPAAEDRAVSEQQLKAAFLFNFTKFVDWPAPAKELPKAPFVIGVAGDEQFARQLEDLLGSESVHGHPIQVKNLKAAEECANLQMLFISRKAEGNLDAYLKSTAGHPVLTIGETAGSAARGAMVNLLVVSGSIKMEINLQVARQGKLEISSNLLKLAKIVETKN
jgi:hypothetical protein